MRTVAAAALGCGVALAQDPTKFVGTPNEDVIAGWLRSGDPRTVAWGAVWATREGDRSLLGELTGLAERWQPIEPRWEMREDGTQAPVRLSDDELDRRDRMTAVLDAVIGMHGELPAEAVERFAEEFPAQATLLLARMALGDRSAVLLRMFRAGSPVLKRSAAAMLALAPPAGFAGELLRGTTVRVKVWISLPGDPQMGSGASSCCGGGAGRRPASGWPETGQYRLAEDGAQGEVLVPGVRPVKVVRWMEPHTAAVQSGCDFAPLTDSVRLDLLAEMLGQPRSALGASAVAEKHLVVATGEEYRRGLEAVAAAMERAFAEVERGLAAKGFISAQELAGSTFRPRLLLMLADGRSRKEFEVGPRELPGVAWVDPAEGEAWQFAMPR